MRTLLKHWFIPHEGNNHKPHALGLKALLGVTALVLIIELWVILGVFVVYRSAPFLGAILPSVLAELANGDRTAYGLSPLAPSPLLSRAAELKAQDMATRGYFSHISPEGLVPWKWFEYAGYSYSYAGENLAVGFLDSKDVAAAWMNSPTHRANILSSNYTEIGIGAARGTYQGHEAIFVVQFFGKPAVRETEEVPSRPLAEFPESVPVAVSPSPPGETATLPSVVESETSAAGAAASREFLVRRGTSAEQAVPTPQTKNSFIAHLVASPHTATRLFYLILATLVTFALALAVFIRIDIQHPLLIARGAVMLLLISSALLLNYYFLFSHGSIV